MERRLLREHLGLHELDVMLIVNNKLITQEQANSNIMRILYYQCVNGVSFLPGY